MEYSNPTITNLRTIALHHIVDHYVWWYVQNTSTSKTHCEYVS